MPSEQKGELKAPVRMDMDGDGELEILGISRGRLLGKSLRSKWKFIEIFIQG